MQVRHPYTLLDDSPPVDDYVHYGGRRDVAQVDDDGTFEVPDDADQFVEQLAARHDLEPDDLIVTSDTPTSETCQEVKADGEVCGRDRPCRYHDES